MGGVCRAGRRLHLEPQGPGPAPSAGPPAGLRRGQLHDQGEEAGTAGATPPRSTPAPPPPAPALPSRPVREGLGLGARRGLPAQARWRVADAPSVSPWQIWVGGTGRSQGKYKGKIYVIDAQRKTVEKELVAHADAVKTLCSAEDRYVLSGSGSGEGKIAIWKVE